MRVLSVIETLRHGGAETVLVELATRLTQHDHAVVHHSRFHGESIEPWIADALRQSSIPVFDLGWDALRREDVREVLDGFQPDVVLYHWWGQDSLRPWIADCERLPLHQRPAFVAVLHRSGVPAQAGFDAYVLVTPTQAPQVAHIDPSRVHVIPNGVDLRRFSSRPAPRHGQPFTVGRLSNLRHGKVPADWVRIAASFGLTNARFVIPGEGPLRQTFEADIRSMRLEDSFALPGYVARHDVPALLATFDVFCYVTSTAVECHPLALLEAAAAGLPIVAEARGGIPDIVEHGVSGMLARSIEEVGGCLRLLQQDPSLRLRLGAGARELAGRHTVERQVARYEELLTQVTTE